MLSAEENDLLTRVEPGTPMGQMLRRYWMPALLSEEVSEPDGAPKRVELLGESFVAFRDTEGKVGFLPEHCPHRGASLLLARNEECGLRCLYHGWKLDAEGQVLETPNEPERSPLAKRIEPVGASVREAGGVVWVYLGPPEHEPPFPEFEWTGLDPSHVALIKVRQECNWVQAMEGVLDSSHSNYLHADVINADDERSVEGGRSEYEEGHFNRPSEDATPRLRVKDTPYGFRYGALRKTIRDPDRYQYVRTTLFAAPFYVFVPGRADTGDMQAFVPIDSENTLFFYAHYGFDGPVDADEFFAWLGTRPGIDLDEDGVKTRRADNQWLQDREAMRSGRSTSGVEGVLNQDFAVQESMGPIYDRTREHLGAADTAIIHMRRMLMDSARRTAEGGAPVALEDGFADYGKLRAEDGVISTDTPWEIVGASGDQ